MGAEDDLAGERVELTPCEALGDLNRLGRLLDQAGPTDINGTVRALELDGGDLYIGGTFTTVGGTTRNRLAKLNATTGALNTGFNISVSGGTSPTVYALEVSNNGNRLYVGGEFTAVGGLTRNNIAEINLTTNAVDGTYTNGTNGTVRTIQITNNDNNLYIGGLFTTAGTRNRNYIAKVNTNNGNSIAGWNANANGFVYDIELISSGVIVCGSFENIGGKSRENVAKLRSDNGNAKNGFDISSSVNGTVYTIESDGGSNWYVGGNFDVFDGVYSFGLAEVDGDGNVVTAWSPNAEIIYTIAYDPSQTSSDIFAGGSYTINILTEGVGRLSGTTHQGSSDGLDSDAGAITDFAFREISSIDRRFAVGPNAHFYNSNLDGKASFAEWRNGGNFENAEFKPGYLETFSGVELYGDNVIVVGDFSTVDIYTASGTYSSTVSRDNIIEVDLTTDPVTVTSFDPGANGPITDVVIDGDIAYVAGSFTTIGGVSRDGLAAIDLTDGSITSWDPDPSATGTVNVILVDAANDQIYVGGTFSSIGGATRANIALLDDTDGDAISTWNPGTNGGVNALALSDGILYTGGSFTTAGGSTRNRAAAFDADDGTLESWDPDCNNTVFAMVVHGDLVIMGGFFSEVLDCPRDGLAGVSVVNTGPKRVSQGATLSNNTAAQILVSPNPTRGDAGIEFVSTQNGPATLALYSLDGREVGTQGTLFSGEVEAGKTYTATLNRGELTPGVYLLRLECNGKQAVQRITILE